MRKVTIRYKNRSMSQFSRVKLVFDDGWNTFFYDEEGAPFVISNQAYERLCDGWPDTQNEVKFSTGAEIDGESIYRWANDWITRL